MEEKAGLFSVLVPLYHNQGEWKETVSSVLSQNYSAIELLVCDDGTPGFDAGEIVAYIEENRTNNLKRYQVSSNESNLGTVATMKRLQEQSTGEYLTHIAGDDAYCCEDVLARYAAALAAKGKDILGVYGNSICCDSHLKPTGRVSFDVNAARKMNEADAVRQYACLTERCCIHMGATAFLRKEFFAAGGFSDEYRLIEDWPFFLRATRTGARFRYLDADAIWYRAGGITTSAEFTPKKRECYVDHLRLYEQEILPFGRMLSWQQARRVYEKYRTDRRSVLRAYGQLTSTLLTDIWGMHPWYWLFEVVWWCLFIPRRIKARWSHLMKNRLAAGGRDD